jgi:hypothetical protein
LQELGARRNRNVANRESKYPGKAQMHFGVELAFFAKQFTTQDLRYNQEPPSLFAHLFNSDMQVLGTSAPQLAEYSHCFAKTP